MGILRIPSLSGHVAAHLVGQENGSRLGRIAIDGFSLQISSRDKDVHFFIVGIFGMGYVNQIPVCIVGDLAIVQRKGFFHPFGSGESQVIGSLGLGRNCRSRLGRNSRSSGLGICRLSGSPSPGRKSEKAAENGSRKSFFGHHQQNTILSGKIKNNDGPILGMKLSLLAYSIEEKNEGEMKRPVQREECRVESRPPARGIEKNQIRPKGPV